MVQAGHNISVIK